MHWNTHLHILAADTVTAAPGADVNIGNLIVIGNDTKISNIKVNTLIVPQSASQAAKLSYYQTAQSMLAASKFMSYREMNAEEQAGWGNDLFGASFQALPTQSEPVPAQSEPVPELKAVLVPPLMQTGGEDVEPSGDVINSIP